jgi:hypothetical protein
MTVPCLTNDELIDYIKSQGWLLASSNFWNDNDTLVFIKNAEPFFFHYDSKRKYFYPAVIRLCSLLKIEPPTEHSHAHYLHCKWDDKMCYCGSKLAFKECCGKD